MEAKRRGCEKVNTQNKVIAGSLSFIKNIREKDKECSRCHKSLGIRSQDPEPSWEFEGKLCHSCFETVTKSIKEYEVTYYGGHSQLPVQMEGFLSILLFDQRNKVVFKFKNKEKDKELLFLSFSSNNIKGCKIVSKSEASLKKMIITVGLRKISESKYLQIDFQQKDKQESLIFDAGKNLDEASTTIGLMIGGLQSKATENPNEFDNIQKITPSEIELAPEMAGRPCVVCLKNNYSIQLQGENLCQDCLEVRFGRLTLKSDTASYYGGHKAFLAGGMISKEEFGSLFLTESAMLFVKRHGEPTKRWQITIPLKSISLDSYGIEEKARRQQVSGFGGSPGFGLLGGTGFIYESGKEHHLVIPYTDDNGIPQSPRFGVTSFKGKAIREFAAALYDQLAKIKEKERIIAQPSTNSNNQDMEQKTVQTRESPLLVLKMRLARGEITKEEYEELRKMLEG